MAWLALATAGEFETGFAVCLKLSHGLRLPWPVAGFALCALASFGLLTVALRELLVGPAYAVWTGIGAAGAVTSTLPSTPPSTLAATPAVQAADELDHAAERDRGAERHRQTGPDVVLEGAAADAADQERVQGPDDGGDRGRGDESPARR